MNSPYRECIERLVMSIQEKAYASDLELYASKSGRGYAEAQVLFYNWKNEALHKAYEYVKSLYNYALSFVNHQPINKR